MRENEIQLDLKDCHFLKAVGTRKEKEYTEFLSKAFLQLSDRFTTVHIGPGLNSTVCSMTNFAIRLTYLEYGDYDDDDYNETDHMYIYVTAWPLFCGGTIVSGFQSYDFDKETLNIIMNVVEYFVRESKISAVFYQLVDRQYDDRVKRLKNGGEYGFKELYSFKNVKTASNMVLVVKELKYV